jgi:hypothetical protein
MADLGFGFIIRMPQTAITAAKTLIQVKAGNAGLWIVQARFYQITKTTTENLTLQWLRKSAAATVTSFTPLKLNPASPSALAVGGTSATGYNATAEGTDTDILDEDIFNVLNAGWQDIPIPEGRIWVPNGGIAGLKLLTAPAASMTMGAKLTFVEAQ